MSSGLICCSRSLRLELGLDEPIRLVAIIEDVRGMSNLRGIARASDRVVALMFGAGDYCASQGARVGLTLSRPALAIREISGITKGTVSWWKPEQQE